MKLKPLCLLLLAVVACTTAQSEDDIPVENDNQFPPDNNSDPEGNVLNELEEIVDDVITQPSDQPVDNDKLSTIEAVSFTTEAPNADITTQTSIPTVEDIQSTTQEDFVATEDQIASDTTEASVDLVDGLATTEIDTSEDPVNDVTTEINATFIEDIPSTEPDVQEASEVATLAEPDETVSTEPTVTQEQDVQETSVVTTLAEQVETVSTEPTVTQAEELVDANITELGVVVDQDQGEPVDAVNTESNPLDEDVTLPTSANESTDIGASAMSVAQFNVLLAGDVPQSTTEVDVIKATESISTDSMLDVTAEPSVPLMLDVELPIDDLDVKESTDVVSSIKPVDISTTEAIIPLAVEVDLPTTKLDEESTTALVTETTDIALEGSVIGKNHVQTTQTNEEPHNDGATVTPVTPIDPSEYSIRSNKADLEAISPLTLAEAPKEVVAPQKLDSLKEIKADNKEGVSVGATTSANKAAGVDKSVIGVIVTGMVLVVAGITIKKNWTTIKNKFSSSPRPANDRTNHTNGIAPEEVPLQKKDNKNPSPV